MLTSLSYTIPLCILVSMVLQVDLHTIHILEVNSVGQWLTSIELQSINLEGYLKR